MFHSQLSTLQTENRAALVSISSLHTKVMALQSDLSRLEGILLEVLKPGSLRESSKPFTTKENRREAKSPQPNSQLMLRPKLSPQVGSMSLLP